MDRTLRQLVRDLRGAGKQWLLNTKMSWGKFLSTPVYIGRCPAGLATPSILLFPHHGATLFCGLAGIVAFRRPEKISAPTSVLPALAEMTDTIVGNGLGSCVGDDGFIDSKYLGGADCLNDMWAAARGLRHVNTLHRLVSDDPLLAHTQEMADRLTALSKSEDQLFTDHMGHMQQAELETVSQRIEKLKDIAWCLDREIVSNVKRIKALLPQGGGESLTASAVEIVKNINTVLCSVDRLEVRGRDSAGVSFLFLLEAADYRKLEQTLEQEDLGRELSERCGGNILVNRGIHIGGNETGLRSVTMVYKVAAEIGSLGDNIAYLRKQIQSDPVMGHLLGFVPRFYTITAHTRWASVGAITEANCHPVDNRTRDARESKTNGIFHVSLNGDIDNHLALKEQLLDDGILIPDEITTDTKIIPLMIEAYLSQTRDVAEAFRLAVNSFEGSHAIAMHSDLEPGKLFLAQRGSGQAVFIGLAPELYMPTSEVYGFIEETDAYIKVDGEKTVEGRNGLTQGQIFVLDQKSTGGLAGLTAMYYDGTPVALDQSSIKHTQITSRDIDRQQFPHYFLKEISESPRSVERTLQTRWRYVPDDKAHCEIVLDHSTVPPSIKDALIGSDAGQRIRRICFVGQGTAGVAAQVCADIINHYLADPDLHISALKASELSGFKLHGSETQRTMRDTLVIAISQSGTTTDTNRTVDMVKERGAHTLAIVNRRDSDLTFKVDGVIYTSSGRDIEMSVASTKAFYSQIMAGAILGLFIAQVMAKRSRAFIAEEIKRLREIPELMGRVLSQGNAIADSARRLAVTKTYWAAVGSGPNKASADEIRIKLSELCYKTISSDYIEDKKHIDLSSEPLIIVCAAGSRGTVIGDIIKDTAIFQAHKATPVVIADEGEERFAPYASDVFHVPVVSEHLAPILNTLAGHLWGYHAALAINQGSLFMHRFREKMRGVLESQAAQGMDAFDMVLEKSFQERILQFYNDFRRLKETHQLPTVLGLEISADLTLLLKYLAGRLPVTDFVLDFGIKGTATNMLDRLFVCLGEAINCMARPVDAIRHQAKTVTVGTSRISEKLEGVLFDTLAAQHISISQLTNSNVIVLKNLQKIISRVNGTIDYRISGLTLLGEPSDETTIHVAHKSGMLANLSSRVETDPRLKGTKRIVVRQGNVYIGKGRLDDRSIMVIPVLSMVKDRLNIIEHLLLLNVSFKSPVPLTDKVKALGGKYENIKSFVQENSILWNDNYLELLEITELFGRSAEKVAEYIVSNCRSSEFCRIKDDVT